MLDVSGVKGLLAQAEMAPVGIEQGRGDSPFLLICDHAGKLVPQRLADLGLADAQLSRHIGWDIGVLGVSRCLAGKLGAALIHQRYSRLVIDCNRPPQASTSVPSWSDGTPIPANERLSDSDRALRVAEIFTPYHEAIASMLDRRIAAGRETILVSMHSFTPQLESSPGPRPWHVGVLFNRDRRFALALIEALKRDGDFEVGVNEPYAVDDASDYAIPVHGEQRGLPHALLEVRNDLIRTADQQAALALRLERALLRASSLLAG